MHEQSRLEIIVNAMLQKNVENQTYKQNIKRESCGNHCRENKGLDTHTSPRKCIRI